MDVIPALGVMPSPDVIPSERSESRDLHFFAEALEVGVLREGQVQIPRLATLPQDDGGAALPPDDKRVTLPQDDI